MFGLSLSWELDGPVLLDLLEHQRIPIWSHERQENDPLVFGGGPVLTANPEPFSPFLDAVLLGDGEELLPTFINALKEYRGLARQELLKALAQIPGIYIPSLYAPKYSSDGKLIGITPIETDIPNSITKQTWRANTLSHSQVITPEAAWPEIHMVEVVRSCPELCRFCLASYLTVPFRTPPLISGLIPSVEKGLEITKRLGLLGASVTQHPEFSELMEWLNQDRFNDIRLSVSSVRASTMNLKLSQVMSRRGSKSATIAIESGSERLRKVVNKKLSEDEIFEAAKYAKEGGLKALKLYGMVGLPTEEKSDIEATANLLIKLKKSVPGLRLTLGVSTFVPKAHTPFQWQGVRPEAEKHLKRLSKQLNSNGIEIRAESFKWSLIQALLARSDRRLAPVMAAIRGNQTQFGSWKLAYKEASEKREEYKSEGNQSSATIPPPPWKEVIQDCWDTSQVLPWQHLKGPLSNELLIEHQHQAINHFSDS